MFQIAGHAALVGVQEQEVVGIDALLLAGRNSALIAERWLFDLDDVGPEPGECLGARGTGFKLREIDYANAVQCRPTIDLAWLHAGQCTTPDLYAGCSAAFDPARGSEG